MRIIPKFLRRKPKKEPIKELPKNTWDYSYIYAIHPDVLTNRLKGVDRRTLDCTDKMILHFLELRLTPKYTIRNIVWDIQTGAIAPDFSMDDLALFFHRHIIK
jgi:hypothetical protein